MKLSEYLDLHKITYVAFAETIGASHARTVERYAKGQRMPDGIMMPRIVEATGGVVTPNDFFGIDPTAPFPVNLRLTSASTRIPESAAESVPDAKAA